MEINVLNKVITIEDSNGDSIMTIEIDSKGNIVCIQNCSIADIETDYVFNSGKRMVRLQAVN